MGCHLQAAGACMVPKERGSHPGLGDNFPGIDTGEEDDAEEEDIEAADPTLLKISLLEIGVYRSPKCELQCASWTALLFYATLRKALHSNLFKTSTARRQILI
jgi:hypothetical protein